MTTLSIVEPALDREHDFAQEQLPWYVNGTLDAVSARRIDEHRAACLQCQQAIAQEVRVAATLQAASVVELAPQATLGRVMARIDARESRRRGLARLLRPWSGLLQSRPLALTAALQAATIVVLLGVVGAMLWRGVPLQEYRALSNAAGPARPGTRQLRLVFDDTLTTAQIRTMLDHVSGRIVDGPASGGIFTIELQGAAGTAADGADDAVNWLRSRPGVRLAEIIGE